MLPKMRKTIHKLLQLYEINPSGISGVDLCFIIMEIKYKITLHTQLV